LTTTDQVSWTLGNMTGLTGPSGEYTLALAAGGSGITDQAGNALAAGDSVSWINGAGDANLDNQFNQVDLILMLQAGTYVTGQPATWSQGDFDGNGRFDQFDIILIQATEPRHYLQGPFAAQAPAPSSSVDAVDLVLADEPAESPSAGPAVATPTLGMLVDVAVAELADDDDQ
jgi:hypothetical protein